MSDISPAERRAVSKALRRLGPLVLLLYTAGYLDRVNLGTAALTMNADLGISISAFGFATGIFSAGYIALQVPGNLALNRLGPRRWLGLLTVSWGVVAVSSSLIQGEGSLIATRIALGAVEAGMLPGMLMYLTIWFPPRMRGRVTAVVCLPFYAILGTPLSAAIIQYAHGMLGVAGWRWMFVLEGVPTIILGLVLLRFLTDSPATAAWLTEAEREALLRVTTAETSTQKPKIRFSDVLQRLRDLRLVTLSVGVSLLWVGFVAITSFLPLIITGFAQQAHTKLSLLQTGLLSGAVYVPATLVALIWVSSSDRRNERVWHVACGALLAATGTVLAANTSGLWLTLLGTVLLTSGIYAALFLMWQIPVGHLRGPVAMSVGIALTTMLGNIGSFLAPYIVGWLRDATGNYNSGLYFIAASLIGCAVVTVAGNRIRTSSAALPSFPSHRGDVEEVTTH
ncbi:MFS transporter [Streptomyces violaceusniger]|uniref:MFS transporter n=2 Tax=Streptomyces violaceusniger group TaxID=2839105 RepID=A0ABD5J6K7_9ACTN|nr:MFS transporter [Streptomyces violaceusniger]KUL44917.1 MFS transporter [Streptomyces violaceusniger]MEE4583242.1 MFS transporter [Streptomyces sp. DSM 41602]